MYTMSGITVAEGVSEGRAFLILPQAVEDIGDVEHVVNPSEECSKYRRASREFANKLSNAMSGTVPDKVRDLFGAVASYITNQDNTRAVEVLIAQGYSASEAARNVLLPKIARFACDALEDNDDSDSTVNSVYSTFSAKEGSHLSAGADDGQAGIAAVGAATVAGARTGAGANACAGAGVGVDAGAGAGVRADNSSDPEARVMASELGQLMRDFISTINSGVVMGDAIPRLNEPCVIIANDLTPALFLSLHTELVRAVVLEGGQASGHLGTVLRDLCIPAIYEVKGALTIKNGEHVLVDATRGSILVEPPRDAARALIAQQDLFGSDDDDPADSDLDVTVAGSMGAIGEIDRLSRYLNHGLGLLRSEFLFLNYQSEPSEEEMTATFASIFNRIPRCAPLTARTFDFAGDKKPLFTLDLDDHGPLRKYGARVGSTLLKKELRALLRAAAGREIYIVFPLITRLSEAKSLNDLLAQVIDDLTAEEQSFGTAHVALMIETPAAVLSARAFAAYGDMFLIGTSSLAEYAAAPRPPEEYFTPALSKMIAIACKGAHDEGVRVGVAGRFAMRIELLPFFLSLGVSYFTTDATAIAKVRKELQSLSDRGMVPHYDGELYRNVMELASARDLQRLLFHEELNS